MRRYDEKEDTRIALAPTSEGKYLVLKNIYTKCEEKFSIGAEMGRGGSCIVYEAFNITQNRQVLLKEFYPRNFSEGSITRGEDSALKVNLQQEERFKSSKDNFLSVCNNQLNFYNEHARENADELVEIQGMYNLGDTVLVMMPAASGRSWDNEEVKDESLYQILETILSLVHELKLYHDHNLLHCDVKPANVYIFKKTRQRVMLLDYGSVLKFDDEGILNVEGTLSYTQEFAAPELIKALEMIGDEFYEDYLATITVKSDLFSVGASLYNKLTQRYVPRDLNNNLEYNEFVKAIDDFWLSEKNGLVKSVPLRVKKELIDFLSGLLEDLPLNRFDINETEECLQTLLKDSRPPEFCLSPDFKAPTPGEEFLGRELELSQLRRFLYDGEKSIFIYGDGGLGKSLLALKLALEERNNFNFFWTTFTKDLMRTIVNLYTEPLYPLEYNYEDVFNWNMRCLRQQSESTVLIIDNFDLPPERMGEVLHSDVFGLLQKMNLRLIFTSRHRPPHAATCLEVGTLSAEELLQLMRLHYKAEDDGYLPQIIEATQYNTFVVEQAAKILQESWGRLTPEKLLAQMRSSDKEKEITDILKDLFNLSKLSKSSRIIMAQAALLPVRGMRASLFLDTHDENQQNIIRILEFSGWLKKSTDNFISLHPLVREICLPKIKQADAKCRKFVESYAREYSNLPADERVKCIAERMDVFTNAVDHLKDSDGQLVKMAAEFNYSGGRAREALSYFQKYLNIFEKLHPQSSAMERLDIKNRLAWCASNLGDFQAALSYLEPALNEAESELAEEERGKFVRYYRSLADIYRRVADFEKAGHIYELLLSLIKRDNNIDEFTAVNIYLNYAKFCLIRGEYALSGKYDSKAIQIVERNQNFPAKILAEANQNLAECCLQGGSFEDAMGVAKISTEIYERFVYGKNHPVTAESYGHLARVLIANKKYTEALDYLEKAKKILEEFYGEEHPASGNIYVNMALLFNEQNDKTQAKKWLDKAILVRKKVFGDEHPQTLELLKFRADLERREPLDSPS
ncbi:tetratricopeptide repeat protein [bacterium]|nr:tetratricopeptide repeat protein [bacterium]